MLAQAQRYSEVSVGQSFSETLTITAAHLTLGAALIGDFNPLHVDEGFARRSRYGERILHGVLTGAIIGAPLGMRFAGTAIGYLEHHCKFLAPVRTGDTLVTTWTVTSLVDKPKHGGGVVGLRAVCLNQTGKLVAEASGAMLVADGLVA